MTVWHFDTFGGHWKEKRRQAQWNAYWLAVDVIRSLSLTNRVGLQATKLELLCQKSTSVGLMLSITSTAYAIVSSKELRKSSFIPVQHPTNLSRYATALFSLLFATPSYP